MRVLLDTHTLIWAVMNPSRLSAVAIRLISDPEVTVLVSAASAWELATKVRNGKLPDAAPFEENFLEDVAAAGYTLLPVDAVTALRAGRLAGDHKDPFDRMIAAQALAEDIPVLSLDEKLDSFGVRRIW